jgi:DNA invertase Pin-like site-specific DNA recombinase
MNRRDVVNGTLSLSISPLYAAIYARVSTEDQGKGFSLPTEIEACQKLADHEGFPVIERYLSRPSGLGSS